MRTLKDAIRQVILQRMQLAIPKEGYQLNDDDYVGIIHFMKGYRKILVDNPLQVRKLIKDKSILKRYFSTELPEELKYLALVLLGVEFLVHFAQPEDANEGKKIFNKKVMEEVNKVIC